MDFENFIVTIKQEIKLVEALLSEIDKIEEKLPIYFKNEDFSLWNYKSFEAALKRRHVTTHMKQINSTHKILKNHHKSTSEINKEVNKLNKEIEKRTKKIEKMDLEISRIREQYKKGGTENGRI